MTSVKMVLVTRTEPGCSKLADKISEVGYRPIISPLLQITHTQTDVSDTLDGGSNTQALILTSQHALQAALPYKNKPLYIVGEASAELASKQGFKIAHTAPNATALYQHIQQTLSPADISFLYFSGNNVRADASELLHGFEVQRIIAYHTSPLPITKEALQLVSSQQIDIVILQSISVAKCFLEALQEHGLLDRCKPLTFLCFSPAIANEVALINYKKCLICPSPDEESLLKILEEI